ncbi:MAG: DMT family transporter [Paracoccaceae bacterium]|jgi:drug/metabolite transporter (DMT)-like permease|nr:DMT family transporter [Paracoccaceae bacterium]MDG2453899.1 DMT family transporter [Paracoccaceae bacterium]
MRLILTVTLVMIAFAANSVLNRMALVGAEMGPASFAAVRLLSGAIALWLLIRLRRSGRIAFDAMGAGSLLVYAIGFSFAYVTLDAGAGALILFGVVQVTMFAGALIAGETVPARRYVGAAMALIGLAYLLWPSAAVAPDLGGAALMVVAAIAWGIYSLHGRGASDPLALTGSNFVFAVPVGVLIALIWRDAMPVDGVVLAVLAGAITSGLGYALWYHVLPQITPSVAAVAQLTVPVIAVLGGVVFLSEPLTIQLVIAACLVLGGIVVSLISISALVRRS